MRTVPVDEDDLMIPGASHLAESFLGPVDMSRPALHPALALSENSWGPRPAKRVRIGA